MKRRLALAAALLLQTASCHKPVDEPSAPSANHEARYALGLAAEWNFYEYSEAEETAFREDFGLRRQLGWNTAGRVLQPYRLFQNPDRSVPVFITWYGRDDLERMFRRLYSGLSVAQRSRLASFSTGSIRDAELWNTTYTRSLESWPESRLREWLDSLSSADRLHSLGGLGRTYFNRPAAFHILKNYSRIIACRESVRSVTPSWPGISQDNFTACLDSEFPPGSAIVKATWKRTDFGLNIPGFDTRAPGLRVRIQESSGWSEEGDAWYQPAQNTFFSMETSQGDHFSLTGLHIMTKELREWLWVTLWWSPPEGTGMQEDAPRAIPWNLQPWNAYGMCVITSYTEEAEPNSPYLSEFPELQKVFSLLKPAFSGDSWCSNPYLEKGPYNHTSNCIGCHQQGGTDSAITDILEGGEDFPGHGRKRVRANFPTDYLWSLTRDPENISAMFLRIVNYYKSQQDGN